MGIKGTVRRTTDGHLIHANIDTDIIISEETPTGSTKKPEELYKVIERFAQGDAQPHSCPLVLLSCKLARGPCLHSVESTQGIGTRAWLWKLLEHHQHHKGCALGFAKELTAKPEDS